MKISSDNDLCNVLKDKHKYNHNYLALKSRNNRNEDLTGNVLSL